MGQVATGVKLLVEPNSENELVDLYRQTFIKDFEGEWIFGRKYDNHRLSGYHHSINDFGFNRFRFIFQWLCLVPSRALKHHKISSLFYFGRKAIE